MAGVEAIDSGEEGAVVGGGGLGGANQTVGRGDIVEGGDLRSFVACAEEGVVGIFDGTDVFGGDGWAVLAVLEDLAARDGADDESFAEEGTFLSGGVGGVGGVGSVGGVGGQCAPSFLPILPPFPILPPSPISPPSPIPPNGQRGEGDLVEVEVGDDD